MSPPSEVFQPLSASQAIHVERRRVALPVYRVGIELVSEDLQKKSTSRLFLATEETTPWVPLPSGNTSGRPCLQPWVMWRR